MTAATNTETCRDCGKEWPARFGRHNCNVSRRYVHNNAIIIEPQLSFIESVQRIAERLYRESCKSAEYADLGGYDSPYPETLGEIDAAIGFLKRFRSEIQSLSKHAHEWNGSDYCSICGADGRA